MAETPRKAEPALREERTRQPEEGRWGRVHPEEEGGPSSRRNRPPAARPRARQTHTVFKEQSSWRLWEKVPRAGAVWGQL